MKISTFLIGGLGLCFSISMGVPLGNLRFDGLIVGGVETERNEFPHQVSVKHYYYGHFCGGVIIDNLHVLTTAHCAETYSTSYLRVVAGEHNLNSNDGTEQEREVDRVIRHPSYNPGTLANDIAILRLRSALVLNYAVQPVALADAGSGTPSGSAIVTGWGRTSESGSTSSILRKVTVPFVGDTICKYLYSLSGSSVLDSMICAGESGKDSCLGDSGGGLVTGTSNSRVLVGIVSWGIGCARPTFPGVYTRISSFRTWISQNTHSEGADVA